jgi:NAD(P)H-hydrate epimerase
MKIFTSKQTTEIDEYTIQNEPVASIDLMERAANTIVLWLTERFPKEKEFKIFAGPGNNGGDALVIARRLVTRTYKVSVFIVKISETLSPDCQLNLERLKKQKKAVIRTIRSADDLPEIEPGEIIIDGIFGSGLSRPVEGLAATVINHINLSPGTIISIDSPSGLFGEDNSKNIHENIIRADYTLKFQFPNLSFFFSENEPFTGSWHILPIGLHPDKMKEMETPWHYMQAGDFSGLLRTRRKFAHKGDFGHALLVSGSYGKMGAAVLGAESCLRTGAGLLTVHVPRFGYSTIQTAVPEAMASIDNSDRHFTSVPDLTPYDAVGIGPGIGTSGDTANALQILLEKINVPVVLDADALNILSEHPDWMKLLKPHTILTPHPGEFARLAGKTSDGYSQNCLQREFAKQYNVILVLKGAYTSVALPDGTCHFNSSGNPGMATGGSGDVLTGMILSLLAQKYSPADAALLGVYLHGLAGDIAVTETGEESLIAGDITANLSRAFSRLRQNNMEEKKGNITG